MNTKYSDYGYSGPGDVSGAPGGELASKYVEIVAALPGVSTVVDLGCGNGYLASELGKAGFRVTGLDASPSGVLVVGTPYLGYMKDPAIAVAGKWDAHHNPNWDGGHIKFYSVKSLKALVESCGFRDTRFHFHGRAPWLWKNMICVARKS